MNFPQESHAQPSRDLYFRLADRLQMQACLQAIEQEGKSVVLHSVNPALLDHYGQILVQRLRQDLPDTPTEIFFPTHTEALLARFNEVLSHVSVDAATQGEGPSAPAKLWIVHDASALPDHELKLLARLLQHLPGAKLSAVLMLNGPAQALRDLDPQGRRLLRWNIEPPTAEQIDQMVQEARHQGREFAALELVARVTPPTASTAPAPSAPTTAASPAQDSPAPAPAQPRVKKPVPWPVLALLLAVLALSIGVAAWLHPEAMRQWAQQLQGLGQNASREAAGPVTPASEAASESSPDTLSASAAIAASEAASAPAQPVEPAASAPATKAASEPPKSNLVTELPEVAQRGLLWLRQLDKDTWLIEHSRYTSAAQARQHTGSGVLTNARIVPQFRPGLEMAEFVVITGPFRSEDRARQFMARNELPASARVQASSALLSLAKAPASAAASSAPAERSRP